MWQRVMLNLGKGWLTSLARARIEAGRWKCVRRLCRVRRWRFGAVCFAAGFGCAQFDWLFTGIVRAGQKSLRRFRALRSEFSFK